MLGLSSQEAKTELAREMGVESSERGDTRGELQRDQTGSQAGENLSMAVLHSEGIMQAVVRLLMFESDKVTGSFSALSGLIAK